MNYSWAETITLAFQNIWLKFANFLPEFITALIILVVGLLVAGWLGKLIARVISVIKLDDLIAKVGFTSAVEEMGVSFSLSKLMGWVVKWFFVVVTLIAVANILGWDEVNGFLNAVVLYIPNVLVAVVVLIIGVIAGQFVFGIVEKALHVSQAPVSASRPLAAVAKWAIIIFAIMAALVQLGVATSLIEILFTGLVAMLAIAGGLAFGLGGKEKAAKWLDAIEKEVTRRN